MCEIENRDRKSKSRIRQTEGEKERDERRIVGGR